jgi:hypothetical protein
MEWSPCRRAGAIAHLTCSCAALDKSGKDERNIGGDGDGRQQCSALAALWHEGSGGTTRDGSREGKSEMRS